MRRTVGVRSALLATERSSAAVAATLLQPIADRARRVYLRAACVLTRAASTGPIIAVTADVRAPSERATERPSTAARLFEFRRADRAPITMRRKTKIFRSRERFLATRRKAILAGYYSQSSSIFDTTIPARDSSSPYNSVSSSVLNLTFRILAFSSVSLK